MPDSSEFDNAKRLALIRRLWLELQAARGDPQQYEALVERIRLETDAFRQALDRYHPNKF